MAPRISTPQEYLANHAQCEEEELAFYANLPSFASAIKLATSGQMPYGTHPHFRTRAKINSCWQPAGCAKAARCIAKCGHLIKDTPDFHRLWLAVQMALTGGPDPHMKPESAQKSVNVWDISLWLGAYLGNDRLPKRVYLHAGTTRGARALGMKVKDGDILEVKDFPAAWRILTPWQLESALCALRF